MSSSPFLQPFSRAEEDSGSPRWAHRSRERTVTRGGDRLKALSPTRLHKSSDELRHDEHNARVQFEKLDNQVTTLHSDVNLLTHEVRMFCSEICPNDLNVIKSYPCKKVESLCPGIQRLSGTRLFFRGKLFNFELLIQTFQSFGW